MRGRALNTLSDLRVKIFGDGADAASIAVLASNPLIKGFTTNPTLMRAAGVRDYRDFAREAVKAADGKPISLEVISDDFATMADEAREVASWGANVVVKIPITDTRGRSSARIIEELARNGVRLNITALTTTRQVREVAALISKAPNGYVSIFAGRIADTGRDPQPVMAEAVNELRRFRNVELIWASPRELLNVFQAEAVGCHVITLTNDLLKKVPLIGKDLDEYSLETVRMFYEDARASGLKIRIAEANLAR
jgi:transaldolase